MDEFQIHFSGLGSSELQQKVLVYLFLKKIEEINHKSEPVYRELREYIMQDNVKPTLPHPYTGNNKLPGPGQYQPFVTDYIYALNLGERFNSHMVQKEQPIQIGGSLKGRKTNKRKNKKRKTQRRRV